MQAAQNLFAGEQGVAYIPMPKGRGFTPRLVIVGRFEDYGSGIDYRRPGLCAALEMVKSGQADALLMKNENRLGRNVSENLRLVAALRKTGRRIFFADNLIW